MGPWRRHRRAVHGDNTGGIAGAEVGVLLLLARWCRATGGGGTWGECHGTGAGWRGAAEVDEMMTSWILSGTASCCGMVSCCGSRRAPPPHGRQAGGGSNHSSVRFDVFRSTDPRHFRGSKEGPIRVVYMGRFAEPSGRTAPSPSLSETQEIYIYIYMLACIHCSKC